MGDYPDVQWFPIGGGEVQRSKDSLVDGQLEADFHSCWNENLPVRQEFPMYSITKDTWASLENLEI